MLGYIIYKKEDALNNKTYINWYIDKFKKHDIELCLVYDTDINELPDFAIIRTINPALVKMLEDKGVICFNNYNTSFMTNDKLRTYKFMEKMGINTLKTYSNINEVNKYPVVIKPKDGHGGDRVFIANDNEDLAKKLVLYEEDNYLIQDVASELGKDLRVYVIGNDIIVAILRQSSSDFRSNFSLGGQGSVYKLNEYETSLVNKIIELFKFDFVGIDFIFHEGKIIFNEIEDVVGSKMVYTYTDIDIVELYVEYIVKKLSNLK